MQLNALQSPPARVSNISLFTNVFYHVFSCCILSRNLMGTFFRDNSMKPPVSTKWLNIGELISKIQECDSVEESKGDSLPWIIMCFPLY